MLAFVRIVLVVVFVQHSSKLRYCWCYSFGFEQLDYCNYCLVEHKEPELDNLEKDNEFYN